MIEVMQNIFVGSDNDNLENRNKKNWAILHCCKHPYHLDFVGYRGNLSPDHPQYALARKENEMALNLVDMDRFSEKYLEFNKNMFEMAFSFLDEYRKQDYRMLIHCNQGESRGPSLGLLYISSLGKYEYGNFDFSIDEFKKVYPQYNPKHNIYMTIKTLWSYFVHG